jgi:hypothetical protein
MDGRRYFRQWFYDEPYALRKAALLVAVAPIMTFYGIRDSHPVLIAAGALALLVGVGFSLQGLQGRLYTVSQKLTWIAVHTALLLALMVPAIALAGLWSWVLLSLAIVVPSLAANALVDEGIE